MDLQPRDPQRGGVPGDREGQEQQHHALEAAYECSHTAAVIQLIDANNTLKAEPERIVRVDKYRPFDASKHVNINNETLRPRIFKSYGPID